MSKRAEEAAMKAYPIQGDWVGNKYRDWDEDINRVHRNVFLQGYEQAEKDIISHIREQIERWTQKDNGEEHIKGERTAFNSVLHLLKEMEEE